MYKIIQQNSFRWKFELVKFGVDNHFFFTEAHTHACMHIHTHTYGCMHTHTHMDACMHAHTNTHTHTHIPACTHTTAHTHTHTHFVVVIFWNVYLFLCRLLSFYKGILPPVLAETPKRATKFFTFERYKHVFAYGGFLSQPVVSCSKNNRYIYIIDSIFHIFHRQTSNHSNKCRILQPNSSLNLIEQNTLNLFSGNCFWLPIEQRIKYKITIQYNITLLPSVNTLIA